MDDFLNKLLKDMADFGLNAAGTDPFGEIDPFAAAGIAAGIGEASGNEDRQKQLAEMMEKLNITDRDASGIVADMFGTGEADESGFDLDFLSDEPEEDDDEEIGNLSDIFKKK